MPEHNIEVCLAERTQGTPNSCPQGLRIRLYTFVIDPVASVEQSGVYSGCPRLPTIYRDTAANCCGERGLVVCIDRRISTGRRPVIHSGYRESMKSKKQKDPPRDVSLRVLLSMLAAYAPAAMHSSREERRRAARC